MPEHRGHNYRLRKSAIEPQPFHTLRVRSVSNYNINLIIDARYCFSNPLWKSTGYTCNLFHCSGRASFQRLTSKVAFKVGFVSLTRDDRGIQLTWARSLLLHARWRIDRAIVRMPSYHVESKSVVLTFRRPSAEYYYVICWEYEELMTEKEPARSRSCCVIASN